MASNAARRSSDGCAGHAAPTRIAGRRHGFARHWTIAVVVACVLAVLDSTFVSAARDEPAVLTSDPQDLVDLDFDHIIVGGGLAGMVMANRLSEDREKRVLLIEAGNDTRRDPLVRTVRLDNAKRQIRWQSEVQRGGMRPLHSLGTGLGGSTSINGAKVDGPPASQIDAFRQFGNPSWSWSDTLRYMKKSQSYHAPGSIAKAHGATYDPSGHGTDGPLDITFSPQSYTGFPQKTFIKALNDSLGIDQIVDAGAGEAVGFSFCPHFIRHGTNVTRVSSATAYLSPIEYERSNLYILTGWRGIRINWKEDENEDEPQRSRTERVSNGVLPSPFQSWKVVAASWQTPFFGSTKSTQSKDSDSSSSSKKEQDKHQATGVTVQNRPSGETFDLRLRQESGAQVTLAAGTLITPLVLELSGVGDAKVLQKIGVQQRIDLPGVGRNLADKPTNIVSTSSRGLHRSGDVTGDPLPAVAMLTADKVFGNVTETEQALRQSVSGWASDIVQQGGAVNVEGVMRQFDVTLDGIFKQQWPVVEWEYFSRNLIAIKTFVLQPFSRGYVHSLTKNSVWNVEGADVALNARLFTQPIDMDFQVASLRAARKLLQGEDMRQLWQEELLPSNVASFSALSNDFDQWQDYILQSYDLICHNSGTAAMMARSLGGVVDENFRVYDTKNVHIVDGSIYPLQLSAHPSLTMFGVAEKAADVIRAAAAATSTTSA